ncbi:LysE family transporter [Solitalea sp. MAHUQ-68]|uniref:LysE family transporter n=1 Tax=Solitalea agri TaxID=2953739 RepID=A0A9X2F4A9_9SPHI|nr:LysE family transporter [Solitalea agri]MCO4293959.1 LysE family transporter [Solitalea agri]
MLLAIIAGILVGLVLSLLTGPTFFSLLKISISKGFKSGVYFAFGVFLSDIIYILLAVVFSLLIGFEEQYRQIIYIVGGLFLTGIGGFYIFKKVKIVYEPTKVLKNTAYFFKGFLMCMLNPMMLFYWITISTKAKETFQARDIHSHFEPSELLAFFLVATSLTILTSDIFKSYFVSKYRSKISERHILWLNRVAGTIIAGYAIFRLLIPVILKHV